MLRRPVFQLLTQKYEVFEDDESEVPVGKAIVTDGLIESLMLQPEAPEAFLGQVLNRLIRSICEDADRYNSNLSIRIAKPDAIRLMRFLERFGFRRTHPDIYKRTSGSSLPPSVMY
jgi:hypothetical protein